MSFSSCIGQVWGKGVGFLFPLQCLGCGKEGDFLCSSCCHHLLRVLPPVCEKCGRPLVVEEGCLSCQKRSFIAIDGIRSPYCFEGTMRQVIYKFKYRGLKALAQPLAQLLGEYLEAEYLRGEMLLVPVPLHPHRLHQRGYNQAALLAQEIGKLRALPLNKEALRRRKNTPSQVKSNHAEARWNNVAGAFECSPLGIEQKRILLIDDVCTTGATLDSCAVALKEAGAISVWGLTVAREI